MNYPIYSFNEDTDITDNSVKRKLRAILSADVKGYSRMMGADEIGTELTSKRLVVRDLVIPAEGFALRDILYGTRRNVKITLIGTDIIGNGENTNGGVLSWKRYSIIRTCLVVDDIV